jgi:hypothetical protein
VGGYLSGRYRTRNRGTVESACRIDLRFLRAKGAFRDGAVSAGSLRWSRHGEETGSVGYTVDLTSPDSRQFVVSFTYRGEAKRTVIALEAVPMRFGGHRLYARCPLSGRRCEVLPIVGGVIACRQVHRLAYASQSLDRLGRLREKAERCEAKVRRKRRRGHNRERLVSLWIESQALFESALEFEAARRFPEYIDWGRLA